MKRRAARSSPEPASVVEVPVAQPVYSDVVLHFQFGRSELTEEAKDKLASSLAIQKPSARLSVALEGHADWIGTEAYNERLALDRRRICAAIPRRTAAHSRRADQRGQLRREQPGRLEHDAREGRAQNRRVVIKVGV